MLFSPFSFFGRARQERSILKRAKIKTVNISLGREQMHLPKTPKREPPETRCLREKRRFSKRLQNGIVKKTPRISIKITSWFGEKRPCESTRKRTCPHASNATSRTAPDQNVTISPYRVKTHLPKKLKRGLPGGSSEVFFESVLV